MPNRIPLRKTSHEPCTPQLRLVQGGAPEDVRALAERCSRVTFIRARRARGMTQLACSQYLGCSVDSVELWERGKARIPLWAYLALDLEVARRAA